jgi:DNA-binding transcriptional MerR regulator
VSLSDAAERVGVTPVTLRRWIRQGLIPQYDGEWTRAAIGQTRVVARMRERGHSLEQIRTATEEGRLAAPSAGGEVLVPGRWSRSHGRVGLTSSSSGSAR